MKNTNKSLFVAILLVTIISCSKNADYVASRDQQLNLTTEMTETVNKANANSTNVVTPYTVLLESVTNNGDNTWTWIWSVRNPNPGNGNNGTAQGLSHWGFVFGPCVSQTNLVNAGYSSDGIDWSDFTPSIAVDPSQGCQTKALLKFDRGTTDSQKAYYRLVVNKDLPVNNNASGYYKSGSRTGCGTFTFPGIGCPDIVVEIVE